MVIKRVFVVVVKEFSKVNSSQHMLSTRSTCDGLVSHGDFSVSNLEKKKTVGLTKETPVGTQLPLETSCT